MFPDAANIQLIVECGDLTAVIEFRNRTIAPAIGGDHDFVCEALTIIREPDSV